MNPLDRIGPEPPLGDPLDLHRWDKWMAWHRRYSRFHPESTGEILENGWVVPKGSDREAYINLKPSSFHVDLAKKPAK